MANKGTEFIQLARQHLEVGGYISGTGASLYAIRQVGHDTPFYIGCTKYDISERFDNHIYQARTGTHANKYFERKVNKIGIEKIEQIFIAETSSKLVFLAERELIEWAVDGLWLKLTNIIHNSKRFPLGNTSLNPVNRPIDEDIVIRVLSAELPNNTDPLARLLKQAVLEALCVMRELSPKFPKEYPLLFEYVNNHAISEVH